MKVLIATTNAGKVEIYRKAFEDIGAEVVSLKDLNITADVEENGSSSVENAVIKAKFYHDLTGMPVFANDSGLVIDKFAPEDQPKLLVRRYKGKNLTDLDMINLYIEKLNAVGGSSTGYYDVGLAIIDENGKLYTAEFKPRHTFINKASDVVLKGVPLDSLSYDFKSGRYMSEMTRVERQDCEGEEFYKQMDFIKECFKRS